MVTVEHAAACAQESLTLHLHTALLAGCLPAPCCALLAMSDCVPPCTPHHPAEGASDAMSIVADCYATLLAAANDGRAAKAVPAFMRTAHSSRSLHASGSTANLAGTAAGGTPAAGQQVQQPAQPERRQTAEAPAQGRASPGLPPHPPARHSRHASAESFFTEGAPAALWPDYPPQQAAQQGLGEDAVPQRHNSSSLSECGASPVLQRAGSTASSSQDWNPHGQLSSEEREAAAAAAWEQATGGWPVAAMRSRSSSAASVAGAAEASQFAQQPASRRGSSSSLASSAGPGGSQHGTPPAAAMAAAAAQDMLQQEGSGGSQRSPVQQPAGLGSAAPASGSSPGPASGSTPRSAAAAGDSPGTPLGSAGGRSSPLPQQHAAPGAHAFAGRASPVPPQAAANGVPPVPPRPPSAGAGTWPRPNVAPGSGAPPPKQKVRITLKVVKKDAA